MDAGQINMMLYRYFTNYDYRLHNSFIYSWESDFFAVSGSGYCVEVEVKVSRGDFFRDFEKDKHLLFKSLHAKKAFYITHQPCKGDEVYRCLVGRLSGIRDSYKPGRYFWGVKHNGKHGIWVNDNTSACIDWHMDIGYAPATNIHFHKVSDRRCPNQLYFACPKGLIKPEEIPSYAGLIYCDTDAVYVKKAPYLHKNKQDMTAVLLQKFYNLWQYKTDMAQKIELTGQYNLFHQTLHR